MKTNTSVVLIIVALGGAVAGFFGAKVLPGQNKPQIVTEYVSKDSGKRVVPEDMLPVPRDLLLSPVFYEWTANADGVLVEKTSKSVTLEKDGKRFTIEVAEKTRFLDQRNTGTSGGGTEISFNDVPVGANLRGGVFIFDQREALPGSKLVVGVGFSVY